jgi:hypothetical protein
VSQAEAQNAALIVPKVARKRVLELERVQLEDDYYTSQGSAFPPSKCDKTSIQNLVECGEEVYLSNRDSN